MKDDKRRMLRTLGVVLLAACAGVAAIAADSYPSKTIRLVVPFPAGSGADATARVLANEIGILAHQAVVVENKGGANGFIGTAQVAKAAPDGYTLLLTSNTHLANKFLFKKLPYDPIGDFKPIALYKKPTPLVLVVPTGSPFQNLADVTAAARKAPGRLSYASGNSSSRVSAELYRQLVDADLLYVPYKGNPEGLTEVASGRVDMMFSDVTACIPLLNAGKLRALVVTGNQRLQTLPQVPTASEAGLPKLEIGSWGMFLAPSGTPDAIAEKLNGFINEAVKTPAVQRYFATIDGVPFAGTRRNLEQFMSSEMATWGAIIKRANIEAE